MAGDVRALALVAVVAAGCTVELRATTDAAPCAPSPRFFVADVWLPYVDANQCATAGCHAFDGGHGYLRFRAPGNAPDPTTPLSACPAAWRDNYLAATQLVRCDDPLKSRLLTVPEGKADPHPPGVAVMDPGAAELLFSEWVSAP
jgi:hypothetical protein